LRAVSVETAKRKREAARSGAETKIVAVDIADQESSV